MYCTVLYCVVLCCVVLCCVVLCCVVLCCCVVLYQVKDHIYALLFSPIILYYSTLVLSCLCKSIFNFLLLLFNFLLLLSV